MFRTGDHVRVLESSPHGGQNRLVVQADEEVTVVSVEGGGQWIWCCNTSGNKGYVAASNLACVESYPLPLEVASSSQGADRSGSAAGVARERPKYASDVSDDYDNVDVYYKVLSDCSDPTNWTVTFKSGEIVYKVLLDYDAPEDLVGVRSTLTGVEGLVPLSNVKLAVAMETQEWYYGKLSRAETVQYLARPGVPESCFLVRESDNARQYIISIRNKKLDGTSEIRHRKIAQAEGRTFYGWPGFEYPSIEALIEGHRSQQGEAQLGDPCPKKLQQMAPENSRRMSSLSLQPDDGGQHQCNVDEKTIIDEAGPWYIKPEKITLTVELGSGNFGVVMMAYLTDTTQTVAVKTVKPGSPQEMMEFLKEAQTMKNLRHPHLVKLHGISHHSGKIYLIMELYNNGSLYAFCQKFPGGLSRVQRLGIARQVAAGMKYLASCNYVHCDLAARNILLGDDLEAHIADFGLARMAKEEEGAVAVAKKPWKWTAPEMLLTRAAAAGKQQWSSKCDVWSYGVLCWELYTDCQKPYDEGSASYCEGALQLINFLTAQRRLPKPALCSQDFYSRVMLLCWDWHHERRPDFETIENILNSIIA